MVRQKDFFVPPKHATMHKFVPPKYATLYWEGKLIATGHKEEDRLEILVSGMPTCEKGKLLGIPVIEGSKGHMQSSATLKEVDRWKLRENTRALVFDTTVCNSG